MISKGEVPARVAEGPIKLDQSWVSPLVAPGEFSILEPDLLQVAKVQSLTELAHEAEIEV